MFTSPLAQQTRTKWNKTLRQQKVKDSNKNSKHHLDEK